MELTAASPISSRRPKSAKSAFTSAWQSSKVPAMATLWTLGSAAHVIWRRCISETLPAGWSTTTESASRPRNASIAAAPVSPEVAARIVAVRPRLANTASSRRATICSAKSLKASVGPWKSSCSQRFGPSWISGAVAGWSKPA